MDEILPNALMIGVDYGLFWTLNPKSLTPFVKAFSLKLKHEDDMLWRSGLYIKMAITSSFNKDSKYPNKPIGFPTAEKTISNDELIKQKMLQQMILINNRFRKEIDNGTNNTN